MFNSTLLRLAPAALLVACGHAVASDPAPDIASIAPDRTVLLVSIPDWQRLRENFDRSGFGQLWEDPRIQPLIKDATKEELEEASKFLQSLQIEFEDLKEPTGHVGFALFWPENGDPETSDPHTLFLADCGEHADDWQSIIGKFIDRGLDERQIIVDDDEYRDVKISIITPDYERLRDRELPAGHHHHVDHREFNFGEMIGGSIDDPGSLHFARLGSSFIFASSLEAIELAIDRANGEDRGSLAEDRDFRDALAQHDSESLANVVFLTRSLYRHLDDDDSFGPSTRQIFELLGLIDVSAVSASLLLDTADALVDIRLAILAPEKRGLLALFDDSGGAFEPPAFVGPDTASVGRMSFRFDKVFEMARQMIQTLPAEARQEVESGLDMAAPMAEPALNALGPLIHTMTTYTQPYSADSSQTTWIIDVSDEITINNTLAFLASQAGGMVDTRDFEGTVLYTVEFPLELSVAVGLGRLFIGSTTTVENALRAAGRPDGERLADEPRFRDATRALNTDSFAYFYSDMEQTLRWNWWSIENADKIMAESFDRMGIDGEYRDEMLRWHKENTPEWQKNLPPIEVILRHVGDMAYDIRSTPDGYSSRFLILKPRE